MAKFPWGPLLAAVAVALFSFAFFQVADVGLENSGTVIKGPQNETLVATFSNDVHVSESTELDRYTQGFYDNETLTNSSGTTLVEGTDYEWNTADGGVTFLNTASVSDGENIEISYFYDDNVEEIKQSEPAVQSLAGMIPLWIWPPFIVFVGGILAWGWNTFTENVPGASRMGGPGGR